MVAGNGESEQYVESEGTPGGMKSRGNGSRVGTKGSTHLRKFAAVAVLLAATAIVGVFATARDQNARALAEAVTPQGTAMSAPKATAASNPEATRGRVVVIGDSYASGSDEGGRGQTGWPNLVEQDLNSGGTPTSLTLAAVGGTGYVHQNQGIDFQKIAAKVADTENLRDTNVVVFIGSRNDITYPPEMVSQAASATYATIATALPDARLIVVGPEWQNEDVPAQLLAVRDAVSGAAVQAGAQFVDPLAGQWFTTATRDLIGSDNIHPTDAGHRKMAAILYPTIRAALEETAK